MKNVIEGKIIKSEYTDKEYRHMTVGELKAALAEYDDSAEVQMYVFAAHNALSAGCKAYGYLESTENERGLVKLYAYERN